MSQLNTNTEGLQSLLEMANALPDPIEIDASLSQSGMAADAKAVGDAIAHKSNTGHTHNASEITEGTLAVERLETSGVTANSYGPTDSVTTGTFNVPQITVDTYGRVTKVVDRPVTLPTANSGNTSPYILPTASSDELGGVKIGYTTSGKNYAVQLDENNKMYVNVPWTDTNTHAVTSVFGRTGAVTLTKSDVTSALGYTPPESDTNTHYTTQLYAGASGTASNASVTNPYLKVTDNNTYRNQVRFVGSGATSISSDTDGNITISSTDNYPGVATYNSYGIVKIDSSSLTVSGGLLKLTSSDITNILGYTPANSANVPDASNFVTTTTLSSYAKKTDIPDPYTLPNATTTTKGGVIVGSNISVSSGTISLTKSNVTTALGYTPPTTNTTYTAGTGISISSSNVISCSVPSATTSTLGGVRFGYGALSSRPSTATVGTIYLATS